MNKELISQGIDKFGDKQLIVAIEEFSELQKELCKYFRDKPNIEHIKEELTDCIIMCETVRQFFNINESDIENIAKEKLKRLK